jgi:hypothetical protein
MKQGKDITKIIVAIMMLVQIPVYVNYVLTRTETVTITNPNPIVAIAEAKEDHVEDELGMMEPTPTPTAEEWVDEVFGRHANDANRVIMCESSWNEEARNPNSSAKGLFQIIDGTWESNGCTGDVLDAKDNISCAKRIFLRRGWQPWLASKHCHGL